MKFLASFLIVFCAFQCFSQQFSSEVYHDGFLVTIDGDTLRGSIKYDLETNVISLLDKGKIKTYSSQKAFYFELFDNLQSNYRRFYSIPYTVSHGYKIPIFFELIFEGKVSLMSRESIVQQTVNTSTTYWGGGTVSRLVLLYDFYFMDQKGTITYFPGKRNDLFAIFPQKQKELKEYIKHNRLDVDIRKDLIKIIAFYNSI